MVYDWLAAYFVYANLAYGNPIAYRWRCLACGPREIETTTKATRLLLGFEGVLGSWDYSAGLSRAVSRAESVLGNGYRSAERRVGKVCVSTCRSRWSPYH